MAPRAAASTPERRVSDAERRARLARRQHLAPTTRAAEPLTVARALTALHATEPPTPALSLLARTGDFAPADLETAVYADRTLVKLLVMRRTLWVLPRELVPAALAGPGARVAGQQERSIAKDVVASGLTADGAAWLAEARRTVLALLAERARTSAELKAALAETAPELAGTVGYSPGTKWGGDLPVLPRLLAWLGAAGDVVRGDNAAPWHRSAPVWSRLDDWLGAAVPPLESAAAYAELVGHWLRGFGPGTEADLVWWFGATKGVIRAALADVGAVPVALDDGGTGWLHPDDVAEVEPVAPWAALLPVLDPATMGWRERGWYLDPADTPYLFDSVGNAGTTAWWDGRVVGCWVQDDAGRVRVLPRGRLPAAAAAALGVEAERLTAWLDGVRLSYVYRSPQMRQVPLP